MGTSVKVSIRELEARYGHKLPKRGRGRPSVTEQEARRKALLAFANEPVKMESPEARIARIRQRFQVMANLTDAIIDGMVRALIISGAPGVGKTHMIEQKLMEAEDAGTIRYRVIRGKLTPIELYMKLYEYRNDGDVILLDDADAVYQDETGVNILKAALDTNLTRTISWYSQTAALQATNTPTQFDYEGRLIVITNIDFQEMVDRDKGKLVPHIKALMSRAHYLDTQLHAPEDLLVWTCWMVKEHHILEQQGVTQEQEREAIAWLKKNYRETSQISIRTLLKIATYMQLDYATWQTTAKHMLLSDSRGD